MGPSGNGHRWRHCKIGDMNYVTYFKRKECCQLRIFIHANECLENQLYNYNFAKLIKVTKFGFLAIWT